MERPRSPDSLFGDPPPPPVARRTCPPIPGLYIFPALLPDDIARQTLRDIGDADLFAGGTRDQVMLFESPNSSLPAFIRRLLSTLSSLLAPPSPLVPFPLASPSPLPPHLHPLLFAQPLPRQAIINLYPAGTGIAPHVDLLRRYADGVVGCSVVGGCVMTFTRIGREHERYDVYLPPRSIYILSGPARWDWTHGIEPRLEDVVERENRHLEGENRHLDQPETILRDLRLSVTFRWLKPGADVLS
ncbi:hypothetical protein AYX13_00849 [Cryptococcus neoformans]|nr:hypothetical protein AYX13_00849 [Cryptococcus neoformans var. grubii]